MINLQDGRFAVRDDIGVQLFDESGTFLKTVGAGIVDKCFGLATDGQVVKHSFSYFDLKKNDSFIFLKDVVKLLFFYCIFKYLKNNKTVLFCYYLVVGHSLFLG